MRLWGGECLGGLAPVSGEPSASPMIWWVPAVSSRSATAGVAGTTSKPTCRCTSLSSSSGRSAACGPSSSSSSSKPITAPTTPADDGQWVLWCMRVKGRHPGLRPQRVVGPGSPAAERLPPGAMYRGHILIARPSTPAGGRGTAPDGHFCTCRESSPVADACDRVPGGRRRCGWSNGFRHEWAPRFRARSQGSGSRPVLHGIGRVQARAHAAHGRCVAEGPQARADRLLPCSAVVVARPDFVRTSH